MNKPSQTSAPSVGHQIAEEIREMILDGRLAVDDRLPGEQELAARFGVSRPSIREALKRLAAQNLIRTRRGAAGGNFINRMGWRQARDQFEATATMLVVLGDVDPTTLAEARLALLTACAPLAAERRSDDDLGAMMTEVEMQERRGVSDEEFCASDVRFYRALVEGAKNPMLSVQMGSVIEAIQPLLNMIIYKARDRQSFAERHRRLTELLSARDGAAMVAVLKDLSDDTARLIHAAQDARDQNQRKR
ncbi:FadR family transcriptional regulator [Rhodobacteraceae bacterium NNCM2]|nr:FadR family transcriptional regulator [Coraliihabitans acroporae]